MLPLKEATSIKHKQAEGMPFNTRMFRGLLSKDEWAAEVNKWFDFNILILEELETECINGQLKYTL